MVQTFQDLIKRSLGDVGAVNAMAHEDHDLDVMCKECQSIEKEPRKLETVGGTKALSEANGLKMRCIALEEDILSKVEGYKPI